MTIRPEIIDTINDCQRHHESHLSPYACRNAQADHFHPFVNDIRPPFFHDIDRIIYSRAYTRYIDKTQVFYLVDNDHITHRVLHVQLASKTARTMARFLGLNEDLVEAIALGHDVGHTPFGHKGEHIVSQFCQKHGCGIFEHNTQGFRLFHELENDGSGCNISVQTLDGIICHNGEMLKNEYHYNPGKSKAQLLDEYRRCLTTPGTSASLTPMTLEGCVVRISDVIAYIGRDIEDAITLHLINRDDLPHQATDVLGNNNKDIVNNLIIDLVNNSFGHDVLRFSPQSFDAICLLKEWNYNNIYNNDDKAAQDAKIEQMFIYVLEASLDDLLHTTHSTKIASEMPIACHHDAPPARIAADFVSGMTDRYLIHTFQQMVMPTSFGSTFGGSHRCSEQ